MGKDYIGELQCVEDFAWFPMVSSSNSSTLTVDFPWPLWDLWGLVADALKWLALRRAAAQAAPLVPSKSEPQEVPGEKSAEDGGFIEVDEIEQIEKILSRLKRLKRRSVGSEITLEVQRL